MHEPAFSGLLLVVAVAFAAPFLLGFFPSVRPPAVDGRIVHERGVTRGSEAVRLDHNTMRYSSGVQLSRSNRLWNPLLAPPGAV